MTRYLPSSLVAPIIMTMHPGYVN